MRNFREMSLRNPPFVNFECNSQLEDNIISSSTVFSIGFSTNNSQFKIFLVFFEAD